MKHSLQLKLSQHLTLTPQLQQSIRLLQLSTLELNQEIEHFLQENPLLEREDEEEAAAPPPIPDRRLRRRLTSVRIRIHPDIRRERARRTNARRSETDWSLDDGGWSLRRAGRRR